MLIDTHSHLYDSAFDHDRCQTLARLAAAGVGIVMLPGIDSTTHEAMFALARESAVCLPMMGLHPTSVNNNPLWREELLEVEHHLAHPPAGIRRFWGVGETGIDLHWSRNFLAEQTEAFRHQIELALQYDLPLVIHARDAWDEVFAVLEEYKNLRGVFHAFSGGVAELLRAKELGDFVFGITGVATYKKRPLDDVIRAMSDRDFVLETDAPYLTPEPHRGTRNDSSLLPIICSRVAEIRNTTPSDIAAVTTTNACRLFGL